MDRRLLAVVGLGFALACLLSAAPAQAACAAAWNCNTSYGTGAQASYGGHNYTMAYSRSASCPGYAPNVDNWWTDNGACSGSGGGTPTPTATRPPNATATATTPSGGGGGGSCWATWNASTQYNGGAQVSRTCGSSVQNFQAVYWTQGNDPCTNQNIGGNGEEWYPKGTCSGSGGGGGGATATPTRTAAPTATTPSGGGGGGAPAGCPADQWSWIQSAASRVGLPALFIAAVDKHESNFGAGLAGSVSAGDGLMQVQAATRSGYLGSFSSTFGHGYNDSGSDQIAMGALILHDMAANYCGGALRCAAAKYNGGPNYVPGGVDAYGRPIYADQYAAEVCSYYASFGGPGC